MWSARSLILGTSGIVTREMSSTGQIAWSSSQTAEEICAIPPAFICSIGALNLRQTFVLTDRTYRTNLKYVVVDDERAVAVYRARGAREGRAPLDIDQALFCEIGDGQIADVTALPFDFAAFDAFWS